MELQSQSRESVAQLLRSHGINPTHQRIEIGYALFENPQHPSADQILAIVNARHTETSKATVYNTLKLFVDKGMVRELIVDPNKVFYDPNTSTHHHFYDVATGELTDIPADGVRVEGLPPLPAGAVSAGIDIIVRIRPGPENGEQHARHI
jgi:Fur family iron response transcriptional regulator